jgi:hypothetical protein
MSLTAIDKITRQATRIRNGNHRVTPGQPQRISDAAGVGDGVWQGDLGIEIIAEVPREYSRVAKPTAQHKQLVPGVTEGAKHCLDSLSGVDLYHPSGWGPDYSGLQGPALVLTEERTITHPAHGHVSIPAGNTVLCRYQREFDAEQQRERRNAD